MDLHTPNQWKMADVLILLYDKKKGDEFYMDIQNSKHIKSLSATFYNIRLICQKLEWTNQHNNCLRTLRKLFL